MLLNIVITIVIGNAGLYSHMTAPVTPTANINNSGDNLRWIPALSPTMSHHAMEPATATYT